MTFKKAIYPILPFGRALYFELIAIPHRFPRHHFAHRGVVARDEMLLPYAIGL